MNLVTEQNLLVWMMNIVFLVLEMEMAHRVQFYLVHCAFLYPPKDLINYPSLGFTTREMPLKSVDKRARQAGSHPPVGAEGTGAGVGKRRQLQSN